MSFLQHDATLPNAALALSLRISGTKVTGTLSGSGFCVDPSTLAREAAGVSSPVQVSGSYGPGQGGRGLVTDGRFAGQWSEALLFTAYSADCTAADHGWSLVPE